MANLQTSKDIIVSYEGRMLIISKIVAEGFNITDGYKIKTEKEFWKILRANATHCIQLIDHITVTN